MKKTIYIIAGIVAILAIAGGYLYPQVKTLGGAASPVGTVQSSVQMYQVSFNASTTATTTNGGSIYSPIVVANNSNDRVITSAEAYCNTVATESQTPLFQIQAATSTIATTSNANYSINLTVATTSATSYVASTTGGVLGVGINAQNYFWASGVNLIIATNATDTAVCTLKIPYIQL